MTRVESPKWYKRPRIQVEYWVLPKVSWSLHAVGLRRGGCRYVWEGGVFSNYKVSLHWEFDGWLFLFLRQGNCPSQVCPCRSRTRTTDWCEIDRTTSDIFYLVLYVNKAYVDLKLVQNFDSFHSIQLKKNMRSPSCQMSSIKKWQTLTPSGP